MQHILLKDILSDELEVFLLSVETSLGISFYGEELSQLETIGQLFEHIKMKIELDNSEDCTTQQAFYKLRKCIKLAVGIDKNYIKPGTLLVSILPKATRRKSIKLIENQLGLRLDILIPNRVVFIFLCFLLLASVISLFFDWRIGLSGLIFSVLFFWFAAYTSSELKLKTIGDLAVNISTEYYVKSRRNQETFNEKEVEQVLINLFKKHIEYIPNSKSASVNCSI